MWTLSFIEMQTGSGLDAVFNRYDASSEGALDAREFAQAAEDMGFGPLAHELFLELDPDGTGSVTHEELSKFLKRTAQNRSKGCSNLAKRFLTGLAFDQVECDVDASEWVGTATTPDELREELRQRMLDNGLRVTDLYQLMALNERDMTGMKSFPKAMAKIGYKSRSDDFFEAAFREIDTDGSGVFGIADLHIFVNGLQGRRSRARTLTLLRGWCADIEQIELGGAMYPCALDQVEWTEAALRKALQIMLIEGGLSPLDMLRAWDIDGSGSLSKQEFLVMVKRLVNDNVLWDAVLREVVTEMYMTLSKGNKKINILQFENWLNHKWMPLQQKVKKNRRRLIQNVVDAENYVEQKQDKAKANRQMARPKSANSVAECGYDTGRSRGYHGSVYQGRLPSAKPPSAIVAGARSLSKASVMLLPPTGIMLLPLSAASSSLHGMPNLGTLSSKLSDAANGLGDPSTSSVMLLVHPRSSKSQGEGKKASRPRPSRSANSSPSSDVQLWKIHSRPSSASMNDQLWRLARSNSSLLNYSPPPRRTSLTQWTTPPGTPGNGARPTRPDSSSKSCTRAGVTSMSAGALGEHPHQGGASSWSRGSSSRPGSRGDGRA